jgi:dipeptidyl aminopeptidase/acylaminoacyl peptidase
MSTNGEAIACIVASPDIPADVFLTDIDGTNEQRLTDLNADILKDVKLHRCEPRTFTAPDGLEVHGWVMEGDGPKPQPLLLDIHGGPHNAWSPTFDAVHLYHEMLASKGWSILRLNPRGSDGYGEKFMAGVLGGWGIYDEQDFTAALDGLIDEGIADPDRLAVCGYSYGGFMTNWLTARTDRTGHNFRAAMSGGTVSDLQSIYGTSDFGFWMGKYEHGGELHEARDRFAASSPLSFVENVKTPTLILHGESDDRCPIGQAEQWFISLQRLGVTSEFVRYPGGSHLFILQGRPSHRVDYNRRIADWMTEHTKGG